MLKDKLLEFRSEDGWEPLCYFLGKPVPRAADKDDIEPHPRVNDAATTVRMHAFLWRLRIGMLVGKFVGLVLAVGVGVGGLWYFRWRKG